MLGYLTWRTSGEQLSSRYGAKPAAWWLMFTISTPPFVEQMSTRTNLVSPLSLHRVQTGRALALHSLTTLGFCT